MCNSAFSHLRTDMETCPCAPPFGGSRGGSYLHTCLLLLAGTRAAILRVGFVELPRQVEREGTTGGVVHLEVAIAVDDGIGLVAVEEVVATQVYRERAKTAEAEILLHAEVAHDAGLGDVEVIVVAFGGKVQVSTQAQVVGQLDGVAP